MIRLNKMLITCYDQYKDKLNYGLAVQGPFKVNVFQGVEYDEENVDKKKLNQVLQYLNRDYVFFIWIAKPTKVIYEGGGVSYNYQVHGQLYSKRIPDSKVGSSKFYYSKHGSDIPLWFGIANIL